MTCISLHCRGLANPVTKLALKRVIIKLNPRNYGGGKENCNPSSYLGIDSSLSTGEREARKEGGVSRNEPRVFNRYHLASRNGES